MKIVPFLLILSIPLFCQGQTPEGTCRIMKRVATEFHKKDTLNHKIRYEYYNCLNNELTVEKLDASMLNQVDSEFRVVLDEPEKYVQAKVDSEGDSVFVIYLYDENKNRIHNYQIDSDGDTLNSQKRIYDKNGNCLELYNKNMIDSSYYLRMIQKFDDKNNPTERMVYSIDNKLIGLDKFENKYSVNENETVIIMYKYVNNKGYIKQYESTRKGNIIKTKYYYSRDGYNYGIKFRTVKGGYSIEEFYNDGTLKSKELYDNKKKIVASVYVFWETIKSP